MKAFIVGSGFDNLEGFEKKLVSTNHGEVEVFLGNIGGGSEIAILPRRKNHQDYLPSHINFLGNIQALKEVGASSILSLSTVGSFDSKVNLASTIIPSDIFFPENRLPGGELCTIFQERGAECGHLIFGSLFHSEIQKDLQALFPEALTDTIYIHANGPRFNTKTEAAFFENLGGSVISQTCGPEAVLANELEIPYGQLLFTIDYVNGVETAAIAAGELEANIGKSKEVFLKAIKEFSSLDKNYQFENTVHRAG